MIIEQAAQQLPPVDIQVLLKLGVRQARGVRAIQEVDQRLEPLPAGGKRSTASRIRRAATAIPNGGCIFAVSPPDRQDFIARGVKFATTGVEIGGHAGHLRWSTLDRATPTSTPDIRVLAPAQPAAKTSGKRPKTPARARANSSTPGITHPWPPQTSTPGSRVTAPNPVSTGHSLSVQPNPRVP